MSTKISPRTICEQPNMDAKTEALFDDRSTIEFMSTPQPKDYF